MDKVLNFSKSLLSNKMWSLLKILFQGCCPFLIKKVVVEPGYNLIIKTNILCECLAGAEISLFIDGVLSGTIIYDGSSILFSGVTSTSGDKEISLTALLPTEDNINTGVFLKSNTFIVTFP